MSYLTSYQLAQDENFKAKVAVAILTSATNVAAEAQGQMSLSKYQKRQVCARNVLNNQPVQQWANVIVTNPVIDSNSSDSDIQFTSNSIFDAMAGVLNGE